MDPTYIPLLTTMVALGSTLSAVALGQWWQDKREAKKDLAARKLAFSKQQLDEFYGPLSGLLSGVEVRRKIFDLSISKASWEYDQAVAAKDTEATEQSKVTLIAIKKKSCQHYRDIDTQAIKDMVKLFECKYALAEQSTIPHLANLQSLSASRELFIGDLIEPSTTDAIVFNALRANIDKHTARLLSEIKPTSLMTKASSENVLQIGPNMEKVVARQKDKEPESS